MFIMDLSKVKLIIWDLDDTLWEGTLSEGAIKVSTDIIELVKRLSRIGIVNSICSKNDEASVLKELNKIGLSSYFVFNSINWEPKGNRVHGIIQEMALRPQNTLFIDDNISNLKEVEHYNDGIMVSGPEIIHDLFEFASEKDDGKDHSRIDRYKLLEKKRDFSKTFTSNEDFLFECDIKVKFSYDCLEKIERLTELVNRTNQLNYTKIRSTREELVSEIKLADKSGYVEVSDKFGYYGIVGFFLIKDNKLIHFLFSCRTIGQGVEQYVYSKLGCPQLVIVGEVATKLDKESIPAWIHESDDLSRMDDGAQAIKGHFLFKGPCDMSGMVGYLKMGDRMHTEFTFTNDNGHVIETHNHSAHILANSQLNQSEIKDLVNSAFFLEDDNFKSILLDEIYDVVFLSTLIEGIYGRYRCKDTGYIVAFGHYNYPLTNKDYWSGYQNNEYVSYGYSINQKDLEEFSNRYDYIGRTSPEEYISFLKELLRLLPQQTKICLILGSEIPFNNEQEEVYLDRHRYHALLNKAIKEFSKKESRIRYIEITNHIHSQKDFTNNINHYTPKVYYSLSKEVLNVVKEGGSLNVSLDYVRLFIKSYLQPMIQRILPKCIYVKIRNFYLNC
jgi:FkbH-like protein